MDGVVEVNIATRVFSSNLTCSIDEWTTSRSNDCSHVFMQSKRPTRISSCKPNPYLSSSMAKHPACRIRLWQAIPSWLSITDGNAMIWGCKLMEDAIEHNYSISKGLPIEQARSL